MCGIVGTIGKVDGNSLTLRGLEKLEYRGYDSCGIVYQKAGDLKLVKSIDRIKNLKENVKEESNVSLGHTRWATHGKVTLENAHPHISYNNKIAMVHNGVIENFRELKETLDIDFYSETDTEVILNLFAKFYEETNDIHQAMKKFIDCVEGSYACIIYNKETPNKMYAIRHKSPMLIGKTNDFITVSSDPVAVIDKVSNFCQIEEKHYVEIDNEKQTVKMYDKDGNEKAMEFSEVEMEDINLEMSKDYDTFMLKEIEEQPLVLENIARNYRDLTIDEALLNDVKSAEKIYIVASGTSHYAGIIGRTIIEESLKIPVEVVIGSEFGYSQNLIPENSLFIFLSQSGETADSMVVFNKVVDKYKTLAITNVMGSQLDRNAKYRLNLFAGIEVAVASTKAYVAQIAVLKILTARIMQDDEVFTQLENIAKEQKKIIENSEKIKTIADEVSQYKQGFYLGRYVDFSIALEAALKVKEITYINFNAYPSGELKHGPISLVDKDKITVALTSNTELDGNTRSNIEEVRARDGKVIIFSTTKTAKTEDDFVIETQTEDKALLALLMIMPHQYLAYFVARKLNLDVDKPRNLAKSVTVE